MLMTFENKVALVTGGGRGVGAATAKLLAARGARVAVNYLSNVQAAEGVVAEIQAASGEACERNEGVKYHAKRS